MTACSLLSRAATIGLLIAATVGRARAIDSNISSYVAEKVDDFTATVAVPSATPLQAYCCNAPCFSPVPCGGSSVIW